MLTFYTLFSFYHYIYQAIDENEKDIKVILNFLDSYWLEFHLIELSKDKGLIEMLEKHKIHITLDCRQITLKNASTFKKDRIIKLLNYLVNEVSESVVEDYVSFVFSDAILPLIEYKRSPSPSSD